MTLGAESRPCLLALGLQFGVTILAVFVKGILKGRLLAFFDRLVAFAALLNLIAFFPDIFTIFIVMVALGTGDFVVLHMFQVGKLYGWLCPFAVLEQSLVIIDFNGIRGFNGSGINPGHQP